MPGTTALKASVAGPLAAGWALDWIAGDPAHWHPVAGFGRAASLLERLLWRPSRTAGALHTLSLVAAVAAGTARFDQAFEQRPTRRFVFRTAVIWATLGGRSLERAGLRIAAAIEAGDLERARRLALALVGRDPSELDAAELSRAAVESLAENSNDAVVAPLLWAALLGAPGAAAYRAVNTLDAMVGHRSERYLRFGWAAARLDDLANWPAARLAALLVIVCAPLVGGERRAAWQGAWQDGAAHPSPNAGRVEGAFAGALSLRLGGLNRYPHGLERRATLGTGAPPGVSDIARAARLARVVGVSAVGVCCGLSRVRR